jgi:hypothetical protein
MTKNPTDPGSVAQDEKVVSEARRRRVNRSVHDVALYSDNAA